MPQPERRPGGPPTPERAELPRYHQAARYSGNQPAGVAYVAAQEAIFAHADNVDLSAYRFRLDRVDHVAVLGDPPPTALHDALRAILATGEPATIPEDVLKLLNARRAQATEAGPWVEGHYRPGKRLT